MYFLLSFLLCVILSCFSCLSSWNVFPYLKWGGLSFAGLIMWNLFNLMLYTAFFCRKHLYLESQKYTFFSTCQQLLYETLSDWEFKEHKVVANFRAVLFLWKTLYHLFVIYFLNNFTYDTQISAYVMHKELVVMVMDTMVFLPQQTHLISYRKSLWYLSKSSIVSTYSCSRK